MNTPLPFEADPCTTTDLTPRTGIELITEERYRQQDLEGWTPAHDDQHIHGELASSAAVYAHAAVSLQAGCTPKGLHLDIIEGGDDPQWPWHPGWLKLDTPVRALIKAGALIAAEIDRLQRLEAKRP